VLEVAHHTDWWRVWVDGHAASKPYHLPGSHGAWRGIATAESWGGGVRACNLYSYRFNRVAVAQRPGGNWKLVSSVDAMHQGDNRFVPRTTSSFVARTKTLPPAPQTTTRGTAASHTATADNTSTTPTTTTATSPAGPPTTGVAPPAVDAAPPPANPTVPVDPDDSGDPSGDGHGATP
jgi:hypothetical protein